MIKKEEVYKIGVLNKPHGIHGELSFTFTDDAFDRAECDYIVCMIDGILVPFFVEEYRFRSATTALIRLAGIDTTEKARMLTNIAVYFPIEYAEEATPDEDSPYRFAGYLVRDVREGDLGEIEDIDDSTENTLFVVNRAGNELLIPARAELIVETDDKHRTITMNLPEGLLTLEGN